MIELTGETARRVGTREEWNQRNILKVSGSVAVLESLRRFLMDVSTRGEGYSYLSEYSGEYSYCMSSPRWRLHVQGT